MNEKKILIVDDEPDVRKALEMRLSAEGYTALQAEDGAQGLRLALKEQPDLIILDVDMPGMDGGEVAAKLKNDEKTKHIPIIFLTCLCTENDGVGEGNNPGDLVYMGKPYNPKELLEQIQQMV